HREPTCRSKLFVVDDVQTIRSSTPAKRGEIRAALPGPFRQSQTRIRLPGLGDVRSKPATESSASLHQKKSFPAQKRSHQRHRRESFHISAAEILATHYQNTPELAHR